MVKLRQCVRICMQVERDIMIWNNKKYEAKPVFAKSNEDSLIARHRRWYSMFYSENSPRLQFRKDDMSWWWRIDDVALMSWRHMILDCYSSLGFVFSPGAIVYLDFSHERDIFIKRKLIFL